VASRPAVFGEKGDAERIAKTLAEDVPAVLDYLESIVPADGFLFGTLGIADVSIAAFFRNAKFARFTIDAARWPKSAAFVARVLASPPFAKLAPLEDRLMRVPIAAQRKVLEELGVAVTADTFATDRQRRGVMPI
jgi:glutathione S-transferase